MSNVISIAKRANEVVGTTLHVVAERARDVAAALADDLEEPIPLAFALPQPVDLDAQPPAAS